MLFLTVQGISFLGFFSYGQTPDQAKDSLNVTVLPADTLKTSDTLTAPKGDIETTILYSADDSIRMDVVKRIVYLYGNAKITYGHISLTAGRISIDWSTNIVTAKPVVDSNGTVTQKPIFNDAGEIYQTDTIKYNFKTRKGLISGVLFKQDEGIIHGERVKKVDDDLYIRNAKYTTCNLAHPHFFINASKLKVIPNDKVVAGPFNMVIADVPTPFGFFLGFFPFPKKQKSGFIIPTVGSSQRGFFFREGGYYFWVNDYLGLKATGNAYANGSFLANFQADYRNRYKFQGLFKATISQTKNTFDKDNPLDPLVKSINIAWTHRTLRKRNSNLSANVNAGSNNFYKRTSYNPTLLQQGTFTSTVNYYKSFGNTPFSVNLAARQDQNISTGIMNFTLPEATVAMNRIYPLKTLSWARGHSLFENLNLAYTGNAKFFVTNDSLRTGLEKTLPFTTNNIGKLVSKAQYGAQHSIPINTTIKFKKSFLKYFNFSPSAVYTEYWNPYQLQYDTVAKKITVDTIKKFSRTYDYSAAMTMSTTIYGLYKFKGKKLSAIRHTLIPNISYVYKPDFSNQSYQRLDTNGKEILLPKFNGAVYGFPSSGTQNNLAFSVNNSFEGKGMGKKDTTGIAKKFPVLEQLNLSGSYNFAAPKFKLSVLNATARTRIIRGRFDILGSATYDPYNYRNGLRFDTVTFTKGIFTNANFSIGMNLNKKAETNYTNNKANFSDLQFINSHPEQFVDFNIPWTLFVRYNLNYSRVPSIVTDKGTLTQAIQFNGDLRLTPKWVISFNSGYDLKHNQITTTRIDINRDLHCWQMAFNVVPFGPQRSYAFTLSAKASILQDLKLNKRNTTYFGTYY